MQPIYTVRDAHSKIINAIDGAGGHGIQCGAPELVTGSRDGEIINSCPVALINFLFTSGVKNDSSCFRMCQSLGYTPT
jgi:hypothetical protein